MKYYTLPKSKEEFLNEEHWLYAMDVHASNFSEEELDRHTNISSSGIRITRHKGDYDKINRNLNSRCEIVAYPRVPWQGHFTIDFEVELVNSKCTSTFFQLMGKNTQNKTKPLLTLDVHNNTLNARDIDFPKGAGANGWFIRHPIAPYTKGLYKFNIEIKTSTGEEGLIRVYMNDVLVYEKSGQNYWSRGEGHLQVQYGCYDTEGSREEQQVVYKKLLWRDFDEEEEGMDEIIYILDESIVGWSYNSGMWRFVLK